MRQGPHSKRGRGRNNNNNNRKQVPIRHQTFDSNGPDVRIRGNANQVFDKYSQLARDAMSAGDRIKAENYFQHAEHYLRIIHEDDEAQRKAQEQRQLEQGQRSGDQDGPPDDGDGGQENERYGRRNDRNSDRNNDREEGRRDDGRRDAARRDDHRRDDNRRDDNRRDDNRRSRGPRDGGFSADDDSDDIQEVPDTQPKAREAEVEMKNQPVQNMEDGNLGSDDGDDLGLPAAYKALEDSGREQAEEEAAPVKRGRGRPRKTPVAEDGEAPVKRPRGRPRKTQPKDEAPDQDPGEKDPAGRDAAD